MLRLSSVYLFVAVLAVLSVGVPGSHAEPHLYTLDVDGDGLRLVPVVIADGESRSIDLGGDSPTLSVIYPISPGQSGDLVQQSLGPRTMRVRRQGDSLQATLVRQGADPREFPAVRLSELATYRVRVNVTRHDGSQTAFVIENGMRTYRDRDGPVMDMFRGMVPMSPGDVSITLQISREEPRAAVSGTAAVLYDENLLYASGRIGTVDAGEFIVDLAAGRTVVARSALPAGIEVRPVTAVEYSSDGPREIGGEMHGAGGAVGQPVGLALLPVLAFGGLVFRDVEVMVLPTLPRIGRHQPSGILGVELLSRARYASVEYAAPGDAGRLRLGQATSVTNESVDVPFHRVGQHLFVDAAVDTASAVLILDTGARRSHIVSAVAERAGLRIVADPNPRGTRGLDGKKLDTRFAPASRLVLADAVFDDVPFVVADLPVFGALGVADRGGLLGNTFLERFSQVEVDFEGGLIRLVK